MVEEANQPKRKRRLRTAPETVRERAAKATGTAAQKPKRVRWLRKLFAPLRPVGRVLKRIGNFPPIRFIGLILVPPYFRNSWRELRLVTWPGRRESLRLTSAVIIFAIIFGVLIAATDYGLDKVFKKVILKQ